MLSDVRRKKLTHLFHLRDTDNDGFLEKSDYEGTAKRLATMFKWVEDSDSYNLMLGAQVFEWEEMQKFADANHDDKVTLDEFLNAYEAMPSLEPIYDNVDQMLHFVFGWFDSDYDGDVQPDEYAKLLSVFNVEEARALAAFALLDANHDGKLSEAELRARMRSFFLSDDEASAGNHFWGKLD
jgi:Ca2+-binding EF-hand superfamily protein